MVQEMFGDMNLDDQELQNELDDLEVEAADMEAIPDAGTGEIAAVRQ